MRLLFENWRGYLEEDDLQEKTRAAKKGIQLPKAVDKLKEYLPEDDRHPKYFMQFSDINKLGINPKSTYNTPLGIYSYPITSLTYLKFAKGKLPFAQDRKFVLVFKPRESANIVYSWGNRNNGGISDEEYEKHLLTLFSDKAVPFAQNDKLKREFQQYKHGRSLTQTDRSDMGFDYLVYVHGKLEAVKAWSKNSMVKDLINFIIEEWAVPPYGDPGKYEEVIKKFQDTYDLKDDYFKKYVGEIASDFSKADFLGLKTWLQPLAGKLERTAKRTLELFQKQKGYDASDDLSVVKATPTYDEMLRGTYKKHNMGYLWWLTRHLPQRTSGNSKAWRTLLQRVLGIDGVVDMAGEGLIHDGEPVQGVFFSRGAIDQVATIPNTETPEAISRRDSAKFTQDVERWLVGRYREVFNEKLSRLSIKALDMPRMLFKMYTNADTFKLPDEISSRLRFANWVIGIPQEDVIFFPGTEAAAEQERSKYKSRIDAYIFDQWDMKYFNKFKDATATRNPKMEITSKEMKQVRSEMADMTFKFYDAIKDGSMNIKDAVATTKKEHEDFLEMAFY